MLDLLYKHSFLSFLMAGFFHYYECTNVSVAIIPGCIDLLIIDRIKNPNKRFNILLI